MDYDDGDKEQRVKPHLVRPRDGDRQTRRSGAADFRAGDRVEARFKGGERWHPAKISAVHGSDGTYDLAYDDGDEERRVKPHLVRKAAGRSPRRPSRSASPKQQRADLGDDEERYMNDDASLLTRAGRAGLRRWAAGERGGLRKALDRAARGGALAPRAFLRCCKDRDLPRDLAADLEAFLEVAAGGGDDGSRGRSPDGSVDAAAALDLLLFPNESKRLRQLRKRLAKELKRRDASRGKPVDVAAELAGGETEAARRRALRALRRPRARAHVTWPRLLRFFGALCRLWRPQV